MDFDIAALFIVIAAIIIWKLCVKIKDLNHIIDVDEERDTKSAHLHYKTTQELEEAREKIKLLESQNARLREKSNDNPPAPPPTSPLPKNSKLSAELASCKSEIKKLNQKLRQKEEQNNSLKKQVRSCQNEIGELKTKLNKKDVAPHDRNYNSIPASSLDAIILKKMTSSHTNRNVGICWDNRTLQMFKNGIKAGRLKKAIDEKTYTRFASAVQIVVDDPMEFSVDIFPHDKKERKRIEENHSNGLYRTTLKNCSCYYFRNTSSGITACKHMLALALYLNIITPDGKINDDFSIQIAEEE